jgi:hypothetical protein
MKKVTIVLVALAAFIINLNSAFASENKVVKTNNQKLADKITNVFYSTPTQDLMDDKVETLTIHFKINQNHEFELLKVEGKNTDLVRYSTLTLKNRKIKVDPAIESKEYELPVKFINL